MVFIEITKEMDWVSERELPDQSETGGKIETDTSQSFVPLLGKLKIPENIFELLWFGSGICEDDSDDEGILLYSDDDEYPPLGSESCQILEKISITDENFPDDLDENDADEDESFPAQPSLIKDDPSLIYLELPVEFELSADDCEKDGYFPIYARLDPNQRGIYLNWLCDIKKPVHISYVFLFYFGLERYLLSEKYRDAVETILTLREYHNHPRFMIYSEEALIVAAILHKDKRILTKILENFEKNNTCHHPALLGKFLLKRDLSANEIISLSARAGFKNQTYMTGYPKLFQKEVESALLKEFGKKTFPFYDRITDYFQEEKFTFANCSFHNEIRSTTLPSIVKNSEFLSVINSILSAAHNSVKTYIKDQKKAGFDLKPENVNLTGQSIPSEKFRSRFDAVIRCFKPAIPQNFSMTFTSSRTNCLLKADDLPYGIHYEFDDWQTKISVELLLDTSKQPQFASVVRGLSKKPFLNLPQSVFNVQGTWLRLQFFFAEDVQPSDIANALKSLIEQTYPDLKQVK